MNFESWSKEAKSEYTCNFGKDGIRDVYTIPCGIVIQDEVILPRSIFRKQHQQTLVDVILPESQKEWVESNGARWDTDRYLEDGYGQPMFEGEGSTKRAFEFAQTNHDRLLSSHSPKGRYL